MNESAGARRSCTVACKADVQLTTRFATLERQEFPSKRSFDTLAYCNTQLFVDRDNSLQGTVLADFALLGGSVVLLSTERLRT